ncbi:MAG: ATP-binding protein [Candidatus Melainabacteria bacterium]|nr:ATP-binding protein [Candidatus Melainabacteria bacterium]
MPDANLIQRHLASSVIEALQTSRIVNIVGPRQAGKSTLVEKQVPVAEYITMDSDTIRNTFSTDAYAQLRTIANRHKATGLPIALDEVQRVPEITLALKRIVDEDNRKGQFVLTGSADVFSLARAGDSLAGRVHTLILRPLSAAEIKGAGVCRLLDAVEFKPVEIMSTLPPPSPYSRVGAIDLMLRGGFPEIRPLDDRQRMGRYGSYIDSIIVKDVPIVAPVRKPDLLRRLIDQLAARTAQELNMSKLCTAVGARKETVGDWLDTLERLCMVQRSPSWASSDVKKAVHWPKLHFLDTGCATALRNETADSFDIGADPTALGAILESYVYSELDKTLPLLNSQWHLSHWRSKNAEIDIIAEGPGRRLALFEMKASSTVSQADFKPIDWFLQEGPGKSYAAKSVGFVVYLGDQLLAMGPGRICFPLSMLWSF